MNDQIVAIIVAAGTAARYGENKILETIGGRQVIVWSVETFAQCPLITSIVVVTQVGLIDEMTTLLRPIASGKLKSVVAGGERRQDSVANGLAASDEGRFVLVHDGARPLVTPETIHATISALRSGADAAIAAIPVVDTIKSASTLTVTTIDRTSLFRAQTPQGFRVAVLRDALDRADTNNRTYTDESALVEELGFSVVLVPGDERALKLTVPGDRTLVEALIAAGDKLMTTRSGIGYDVHRFVDGRLLVLGGIVIPHSHGLEGHSDADVVLHAIADAILGACALGDIGQHFPPDNESYRDISSLVLLDQVTSMIRKQGFSIGHIDAMVIAELPRIGPHVPAMRDRIAQTLGLPMDSISIKATTNEGMGFIGRQEGIAVMATATVQGPR